MRANAGYCGNGQPSRSFIVQSDIQPLKEVDAEKSANMLARVQKYPPYDSHTTGIYNVNISKLVTPQIIINLDRAERRTNTIDNLTEDQLFDLSFNTGSQPQEIVRQILAMAPNAGAVVYTSYDEDIRLHHPPYYRPIKIVENDPESPSFESICLPIGGGAPFAAAYRIPISQSVSRLVLGNGIHRVYRLAAAGYQTMPLVVTDLVPMEISDPFVDLPKSILLDPTSNAPLMIDFLNQNVTIPLEYYTTLKTIRVNWNFEQYVTVLK
jgi:hypothetical protein